MPVFSTIHNEQWESPAIVPVGNIIAVLGIASQGPLDPVKVTTDTYQQVYGKLLVDPTLINDLSLNETLRNKIETKYNRSLIKVINEIFNFGDPNLPVVALRIGQPTYAQLALKEQIITGDEVDSPTSVLTLAIDSGAGSLAAGDYTYAYAYKTQYGETQISPIATITGVVNSDAIDISDIGVSSDSKVIARVIYRSNDNGVSYGFLTEISDNTTTTFTDDGSITLDTNHTPSMYNASDVPGPSKPTMVGSESSASLTFKSRVPGDEYNYFYAKVEQVTDSVSGATFNKLSVGYSVPPIADSATGSVNAITDTALNVEYNIDIDSYSLEDIVTSFNNSAYGKYLIASVNYIESEYVLPYYNGVSVYTWNVDEVGAYRLKDISEINIRSTVSNNLTSGTDMYILDAVPYKTLNASSVTVSSATVTQVIDVPDTNFTLSGTNYEANLTYDSYKDPASAPVLVSVVDVDGTAVTASLNDRVLSIANTNYDANKAPYTVTVKYDVILAEAKYSEDILVGIWNSYFVAGNVIYFGDSVPYDIELKYDTDIVLKEGEDYVIASSGSSGDRDDVISINIINGSNNLASIATGTLTITYSYLPLKPGTVAGSVFLSGGADGSDMTPSEYKAEIEKALAKIVNYAPSDLIIAGTYLDETIETYSPLTGLKVEAPVDYLSVIDPWLRKQAYNVKECRFYISPKAMTLNGYETTTDAVNGYVNSLLVDSNGNAGVNYLQRTKYDNFLIRFVAGDIIKLSGLGVNFMYSVDPAVFSLLTTRLRPIGESKLYKAISQSSSRINISDNEVINKINAAGWEFYSGILGDDLVVRVQAVTERSGAKVGTKLDSQYVVDTVLLAVWTARQITKKFTGKAATSNLIESMKSAVNMAIMDNYYPAPITQFGFEVYPRTLNDKINEKTRIKIYVGVAGIQRVIEIDTYIGIE